MARTKSLIDGFWDRFNLVCKESGLTKVELAKRIGCKRTTLYDSGYMLTTLYLARFCTITHTSADWLLGITNERKSI